MNKIGKPTVTQQMIADAAGCHLSTVSLALRNNPRLPAATRQKIHDVAKRLGYEPNPLVSLLLSRVRRRDASYRGTLGYLHTVPEGTPRLAGRVHQNYRGGARRRASELGYNLDEFHLHPEFPPHRLVEVLRARNIDGLVIEHMPSPLCPNRSLPFDVSSFATASLGVPLARPQLHYVANDQYMRAILAARELLALGYRRLGLMLSDSFDCAMAHRCSAGFWAVQEYVPDIARLPICRLDQGDLTDFKIWADQHEPDVILGTHPWMHEMIQRAGLRVPEDIGWVHLDWLPDLKPSSGVYGNSEHTGAAAVDLVVSQLHRGDMGPPSHAMSYLVAGTWQAGSTVHRVGPPLDLETEFFSDLLRA